MGEPRGVRYSHEAVRSRGRCPLRLDHLLHTSDERRGLAPKTQSSFVSFRKRRRRTGMPSSQLTTTILKLCDRNSKLQRDSSTRIILESGPESRDDDAIIMLGGSWQPKPPPSPRGVTEREAAAMETARLEAETRLQQVMDRVDGISSPLDAAAHPPTATPAEATADDDFQLAEVRLRAEAEAKRYIADAEIMIVSMMAGPPLQSTAIGMGRSGPDIPLEADLQSNKRVKIHREAPSRKRPSLGEHALGDRAGLLTLDQRLATHTATVAPTLAEAALGTALDRQVVDTNASTSQTAQRRKPSKALHSRTAARIAGAFAIAPGETSHAVRKSLKHTLQTIRARVSDRRSHNSMASRRLSC